MQRKKKLPVFFSSAASGEHPRCGHPQSIISQPGKSQVVDPGALLIFEPLNLRVFPHNCFPLSPSAFTQVFFLRTLALWRATSTSLAIKAHTSQDVWEQRRRIVNQNDWFRKSIRRRKNNLWKLCNPTQRRRSQSNLFPEWVWRRLVAGELRHSIMSRVEISRFNFQRCVCDRQVAEKEFLLLFCCRDCTEESDRLFLASC